MTLAEVPLVVVLVGLVAYAVLAGADFGAGFWQLTPGRRRARAEVSASTRTHAITPVWEANHVWLILVLTVMWTCYPSAFAAIASTLALPLTIAALGIVLRAIAYVLRGQTGAVASHRAVERVFALSSILVPVRARCRGRRYRVRPRPAGQRPGRPRHELAEPDVDRDRRGRRRNDRLHLGRLAHRRRRPRDGEPELRETFRTRALWSAVVAGAIAFASLLVVRSDAERALARAHDVAGHRRGDRVGDRGRGGARAGGDPPSRACARRSR